MSCKHGPGCGRDRDRIRELEASLEKVTADRDTWELTAQQATERAEIADAQRDEEARMHKIWAALAKAEDDRDRARADAELLALGLEKAEAERDGSITVLRTWQEIANRLQQERDEAVELLRWTRDHNDWTNKDYREWLRGRDSLLSRIDARKGAKGGDSG